MLALQGDARRAPVMSGGIVIGSAATPRFEALDLAHLGRLRLRAEVLVDDADAAFLRDGDREARLGDGVHRRGNERDVELDLRVRRVLRETSRGRTREWAGTSRTSSKVSAFWTTRMFSTRKAALYAILSCMKRLFAASRLRNLCLCVPLGAAHRRSNINGSTRMARCSYGDVPPPGVKAQRWAAARRTAPPRRRPTRRERR